MVDEARLEATPEGRIPAGPGWFVLNLKEARWGHSERFGSFCRFEGAERFEQLGLNVHVLAPGQPACLYHRENLQEDFLVLDGECLVVVEGQERRLRAWDLVHCPPGTTHVFVGAGERPCAILMVGARSADTKYVYPPDETAARHGASAAAETSDPREAYAGTPPPVPTRPVWPAE